MSPHFHNSVNGQTNRTSHMGKCGLHLLAVGASLVRPDHASGDRRFMEILKILGEAGELTYAAEWGYGSLQSAQDMFARYGLERTRLPSKGWRPKDRTLAEQKFDIAFIEFWHIGEQWLPPIRCRQPWTTVIVDSVDVHFVREAAAAALGKMDLQQVQDNKRRELAVYHAADVIVVVTEEDKQALQAEGIERPIFLVPNIVPERVRPIMKREPQLLFVGGFAHAPNADGVLWFIQECWSKIKQALPQATFKIVGSNPSPEILALGDIEGVEVVGYVPETGPYLDAAAVSVAPLRYGGGMKGKVCEAMAAGMPVVTTSVGIQGIPAIDGDTARVADDAQAFVNAVLWALANPTQAEAMGHRGREMISKICGEPAAAMRIADILDWAARAQKISNRTAHKKWWIWAKAFRVHHALRSIIKEVGRPTLRALRSLVKKTK